MRVTVTDLSCKVNHLSKVAWDRKIIIQSNRFISFTSFIDQPVIMMDFTVSKDKYIKMK